MAASGKVYVCGRCGDYGAPNLEDLVTHMTNCGVPEIRKKGEPSHYEDNDVMFDDSDNSDNGIEYADISEEKESPKKGEDSGVALASNQPVYTSHLFDADRTSPSPFLWSKKTALILLNLLKSHKEDMESPYIRRKTVWQKIAMEMQERYGYCVSAAQCENKFKNMSNRYRKAKENNLRSDSKQTCFLYSELDEYFQSDARYQPRRDSMYIAKTPPRVIRESPTKMILESPKLMMESPKLMMESPKLMMESPKLMMESPKIIRQSPKVIRQSNYITSDTTVEPVIISEGENSNSFKNSGETETEPVWVKRMMETFERCHKENMRMQREFIDVLKKILEKNIPDPENVDFKENFCLFLIQSIVLKKDSLAIYHYISELFCAQIVDAACLIT